jgi:N-acetylglucosaminyldiphosphoundecaprenol N-acetyl-beta-D-mannosaminyltransferase
MTPVKMTRDGAAPLQAALPQVRVLGVRVDVVDEAAFLARAADWVAARTPRQVVTINPEFVMRARADARFAAVLETADLATPDGVGVIWAARRKGVLIPERVGGADVAVPLARQCARLGHRLFLLGGAAGVADEAARRLQQQVPGLIIAGTFSGSPDPGADEETVGRVREARPDVVLVAYGSPAQDFWIARNKERIGAPVLMGVGGTLDYLAGVQRRAPALLRRLWLDWAFRLVTQPWRWRRMLALPRFVLAVLRESD